MARMTSASPPGSVARRPGPARKQVEQAEKIVQTVDAAIDHQADQFALDSSAPSVLPAIRQRRRRIRYSRDGRTTFDSSLIAPAASDQRRAVAVVGHVELPAVGGDGQGVGPGADLDLGLDGVGGGVEDRDLVDGAVGVVEDADVEALPVRVEGEVLRRPVRDRDGGHDLVRVGLDYREDARGAAGDVGERPVGTDGDEARRPADVHGAGDGRDGHARVDLEVGLVGGPRLW